MHKPVAAADKMAYTLCPNLILFFLVITHEKSSEHCLQAHLFRL